MDFLLSYSLEDKQQDNYSDIHALGVFSFIYHYSPPEIIVLHCRSNRRETELVILKPELTNNSSQDMMLKSLTGFTSIDLFTSFDTRVNPLIIKAMEKRR